MIVQGKSCFTASSLSEFQCLLWFNQTLSWMKKLQGITQYFDYKNSLVSFASHSQSRLASFQTVTTNVSLLHCSSQTSQLHVFTRLFFPFSMRRATNNDAQSNVVCSILHLTQHQIKSSFYSLCYAETCNEWRGSSPRLSSRATQLRRNVATVVSHW